MVQLLAGTTPLECFERGTGQTVLFVHGSASDHRTWDRQLDEFSERFKILTYSRRYHAPNDAIVDGVEYAMSEQVDDLEQILLLSGGKPTHLIGHSYGAYLALLIAIRRPDLVADLVLAEPPVIPLFTSFPPKPYEILKLLVTRPKTALSIIRFAATGLGPATAAAKKGDMETAMAHFGSAVLGPEAFSRLSPERLDQVRANFGKAELLSDSFMTSLSSTDVGNITSRTLLITGSNSPVLFHRLTDHLEELIPNTERRDIANASHIMHEDNPVDYNQAVLSFLEK